MSKQADKTNKPAPPKAAKPKAVHIQQTPIDTHLLQLAREDPARLTPTQRTHLQRTLGNQALSRLVGNPSSVNSEKLKVKSEKSPISNLQSPFPIQPKLTVNAVGDKYEQEADAVAKEVVQKLNTPQPDAATSTPTAPPTHAQRQTEEEEPIAQRIQRQAAPQSAVACVLTVPPALQRQAPEEEELQLQRQETEDEELQLQRQALEEEEPQEMAMLQREAVPEEEELQLQRQELPDEEEMQVQRQELEEEDPEQMAMTQRQPQDFTHGGPVNSQIEAQINQSRGGGRPMEDSIRQPMEQAFGADFSDVRIHTDAQAHNLNEAIQARAFTTRNDIYFKKDEFAPTNYVGKELLAHELTHVLQQNRSKNTISNVFRHFTPNIRLEEKINEFINGERLMEEEILKDDIRQLLRQERLLQTADELRKNYWYYVKSRWPIGTPSRKWALQAIYYYLRPIQESEIVTNTQQGEVKQESKKQIESLHWRDSIEELPNMEDDDIQQKRIEAQWENDWNDELFAQERERFESQDRPKGTPKERYDILKRLYYGKGVSRPLKFLQDNIIQINFFGKSTPAHKALETPLKNVEERLKSKFDKAPFSRTWALKVRTQNDPSKLSNHALGTAIDFDSPSNPMIDDKHHQLIISDITGLNIGENFLNNQKEAFEYSEILNRRFMENFNLDSIISRINELSSEYENTLLKRDKLLDQKQILQKQPHKNKSAKKELAKVNKEIITVNKALKDNKTKRNLYEKEKMNFYDFENTNEALEGLELKINEINLELQKTENDQTLDKNNRKMKLNEKRSLEKEYKKKKRHYSKRIFTLQKYAQTGFLNLNQQLVEEMINEGFVWGGSWKTKDYMHFELP